MTAQARVKRARRKRVNRPRDSVHPGSALAAPDPGEDSTGHTGNPGVRASGRIRAATAAVATAAAKRAQPERRSLSSRISPHTAATAAADRSAAGRPRLPPRAHAAAAIAARKSVARSARKERCAYDHSRTSAAPARKRKARESKLWRTRSPRAASLRPWNATAQSSTNEAAPAETSGTESRSAPLASFPPETPAFSIG